jgi:hypothetical protein
MMVLVGGGLVSFWGPVIGVVVYLVARDVIGAVTNAWMLWSASCSWPSSSSGPRARGRGPVLARGLSSRRRRGPTRLAEILKA